MTYARTPVMSTYLVAFVVGEFDYVEGKDSDGVLIRVYTPKGKTIQGQFALEVSWQLSSVGDIVRKMLFLIYSFLYTFIIPLWGHITEWGYWKEQRKVCNKKASVKDPKFDLIFFLFLGLYFWARKWFYLCCFCLSPTLTFILASYFHLQIINNNYSSFDENNYLVVNFTGCPKDTTIL